MTYAVRYLGGRRRPAAGGFVWGVLIGELADQYVEVKSPVKPSEDEVRSALALPFATPILVGCP
jgi:hypothetical protein